MSFEDSSIIQISSLEELVSALKSGQYSEVMDQFEDISISAQELQPYLFWNKDHYTRNCIARDDYFELLVLCWQAGQKTRIHSHNKQECFVKVIEGSFSEDQYTWDEQKQEMIEIDSEFIVEGEFTSVENPALFHKLENSHPGKSISLHLYMKPITKCRVLQADQSLKLIDLSYYSFKGELN